MILFLPCEFRTRHFHVKHHVSQKRASCLDTGTHVHLLSVVYMCAVAGEGNWLVSCLRQHEALTNSSRMAVFSFRFSTAAEDKVKKSSSSLCLFSESVNLQPENPETGAAQLLSFSV